MDITARVAPTARARSIVRPLWAAVLVLAVFACVAGRQYHVGGIAGFIDVGRSYYAKGHTSAAIATYAVPSSAPGYAGENGRDGEFYYFVALDPAHAHDYLNSPGVTYSRILYPMAARALAVGSAPAIPYALLIINLLAVGLTTFMLARWLARHGVSTAFALAYGLFPGLVFAATSDLTEPLAFTLAAAGSIAFFWRPSTAPWASAVLFAAALLCRETTAFFPAVFAVHYGLGAGTLRARVARSAAFAAVAFAPLIALRVWLSNWLGPTVEAAFGSHLPFEGLWAHRTLEPRTTAFLLLTVAVPGLAWAAYAGWLLVRDKTDVFAWLVLLNVAAFVVFLPAGPYVDYRGAGRASIGVALASVLMLRRLGVRDRLVPVLWILWLAPWVVPGAVGIRALW